jgi:flagellar basal-body rod protein FlgF
MVRGFYMLGSGILTQSRILSGISNNLANVSTPGYKKKEVSSTTFGSMVINRVDSQTTPIGTLSMVNTADKTNVIHSEGTLKGTDRTLDFAIKGEGFFAVQSQAGLVYTRNGSFNVDQEGYLVLNNVGRVVGNNGPIKIGTDNFTADAQGNLSVGGQTVDKISVYNFDDYNNLKISDTGMFTAAGGAALMTDPDIAWKTVEGSNVDPAKEMTNALAAQRNLQSCSQAIKMYDQILQKAVSDIAKI